MPDAFPPAGSEPVTGGADFHSASTPRITSIDALRGFVMFTMIFVNDLSGASDKIVPAWMKHFHGKSGMTFVDLVFPAFLFIVGMSTPFALGVRLKKGEPRLKTLLHALVRTASLLAIGILMVNETPDAARLGWSGALWCTLMYLAAIFSFCNLSAPGGAEAASSASPVLRMISLLLNYGGRAVLIWLAFAFRGKDGQRIVSLSPFSIHTEWYGILGLIGWAYLVGAIVFLIFRTNRTALLGCAVLLMCLYPADKKDALDGFWLANYVGIGETLGSQAAITAAGLLLGAMLLAPDHVLVSARVRFTLWFIAGCAAGAWLLNGLYGINKNEATPSWCLWACAITAALWLGFYFLADVRRVELVAGPLAVAGQNVLLAYLISELLPSALENLHLDNWYDGLAGHNLISAIARSAGCGVVILAAAAGLNRAGFRLKL